MARQRPLKSRALAVLGTGSGGGKSVITAGLCRLFVRSGLRVAPFKAQNMSNNSYATRDGKEIGRAQALQAQACRLDPHVDMNPILLKPETDRYAQVVVRGTVWGKFEGRGYLAKTAELAARVRESYEQLAACYEVIVIEGAGSAAELNLRDHDLANWSMAELADAQVVLVADIDRGGVFAQVVGTIDLLTPDERRRVCGVIINKFRGDNTLFDDGVRILERRSGIPVIGVVPMLSDLTLDEEDSVAGERAIQVPFDADHVNVAVILLGRMSNFTDFRQLTAERDVCLRYAADPRDLAAADVVIIPGSKNTIEDLQVLRRAGYPEALQRHVESGRELVGICGGFQMLGRTIADPDSVESGGVTNGLGWLDVSTRMLPVKTTRLVEAQPLHVDAGPAKTIRGYSIHMGYTRRGGGLPCFRIRLCGNQANQLTQPDSLDGAVSRDGLVWGTYLHGVFDDPEFRRAWLNRIRRRKGWEAVSLPASVQVSHRLAGELDRWADHLERHLNVKHLCQRLADSRPKN